MNSVIGVIQARMGSSRVPGMAMLDLAGRPLIGHMIDRLRRVRNLARSCSPPRVTPATATLVAFARTEGLGVFQHPDEDDLAGRSPV